MSDHSFFTNAVIIGWIDILLSSLCPQFVPFRDYMDRTGNHVLSMARLAKDVLAEIPDQFISYMKSRGIKPNPAPPPYTPPGHTHHHTQIWSPPHEVSVRTNSTQLSGVLRELAESCFFGANWSQCTRKRLVHFLQMTHGGAFYWFLFFCVIFICQFSAKRGCKISQDLRAKAFYATLGQWLFDVWFDSRVVQKRSCCG